jgi:hypothetical protein
MMESLPEPQQEQVVAHLRDYIADVWDEVQWDAQFERSEDPLIEAARRTKEVTLPDAPYLSISIVCDEIRDASLILERLCVS